MLFATAGNIHGFTDTAWHCFSLWGFHVALPSDGWVRPSKNHWLICNSGWKTHGDDVSFIPRAPSRLEGRHHAVAIPGEEPFAGGQDVAICQSSRAQWCAANGQWSN